MKTSLPNKFTPELEFPAIEQALHPEQKEHTAKSFYKTIKDIRYDRALLEAADERILGRSSSRFSKKDAEDIIRLAKDGGRITEAELNTLNYIRENYNFTPNAAAWFAGQLPAIAKVVNPDQLDEAEHTQPTSSIDQTSSPLPDQDPSPLKTSLPEKFTPALEFPAIEQKVHPDKLEHSLPTQSTSSTIQVPSPLPEQIPAPVETSLSVDVTPASEFPAIEQAEPPDQFANAEPTQPTSSIGQTSSPILEKGPLPKKNSLPEEEVTSEDKTSGRILHAIWGVLLFVTIVASMVLYQEAAKEVEILQSKLAALPNTDELDQLVSSLQSERSALQNQVMELNQKFAEANSEQEQLQKQLSISKDKLASALVEFPRAQSEQKALQNQIRELNQKIVQSNNEQVQLQKSLRSEQDRQASASSEISNLRSKVQSLRERAIQAEQVAKAPKTFIDPAIAEVKRQLQENAFSHSDLFKVNSLKLDTKLEGFRTNENILLDEHYELLNRLIPLLKPLNVNLKLIGHTYTKGGYNEVNLFLSHLPALVVSQYITEKLKFPRERIHVTGRADLKSVVGNTSREVPLRNRSVELQIVFTGDHHSEKLK